MYPHAAGQMTEEFVVLCLITRDANPEHGVRKRFLHHADEFDHVLFRHRSQEKTRTKAEASYRAVSAPASNWLPFSRKDEILC